MQRLARLYSSSNSVAKISTAVGVEDERVQQILRRVTGMDFDRVFATQKEDLTLPRYRLLSEEQLKQAHSVTVEKANEVLHMPSILEERQEKGKVIEEDGGLDQFDSSKWIFTDISMGVSDSECRVVVREPTGTLRDAVWEEIDRMCHVYYPKRGRKMWLPRMLQASQLPSVLKRRSHMEVLNVTILQCSPDSADYIRIHKTVYEDIDKRGLYNNLRSTQHFGGLVWYLLRKEQLEGLLNDMHTRQLYSDAEDLVQLHMLCFPESPFRAQLPTPPPAGADLVKAFCEHHNYQITEPHSTTFRAQS